MAQLRHLAERGLGVCAVKLARVTFFEKNVDPGHGG
jgi:hypothetical protein